MIEVNTKVKYRIDKRYGRDNNINNKSNNI